MERFAKRCKTYVKIVHILNYTYRRIIKCLNMITQLLIKLKFSRGLHLWNDDEHKLI